MYSLSKSVPRNLDSLSSGPSARHCFAAPPEHCTSLRLREQFPALVWSRSALRGKLHLRVSRASRGEVALSTSGRAAHSISLMNELSLALTLWPAVPTDVSLTMVLSVRLFPLQAAVTQLPTQRQENSVLHGLVLLR